MASSLFHALNISRQDMANRLIDLDVVGNNLANMNTTGFKASRANFQELLEDQTRSGTTLLNTQISTQQGSVRASENPLDWAISGEGFFQVELPDGTTGYTRDGSFKLDAEGRLVNSSGYYLVWDGELPSANVSLVVSSEGIVQAQTEEGERVDVGTVELARFANATGLLAQGQNVFLESEASGEAQLGAPGQEGFGLISTYSIEQSNVDMAREMTHLMTLQRSFQLAVRAFQQSDTMIGQAINMRRG
jgi:flagellar basal-body rod protein FlgG